LIGHLIVESFEEFNDEIPTFVGMTVSACAHLQTLIAQSGKQKNYHLKNLWQQPIT
jgi:hypothetical protein